MKIDMPLNKETEPFLSDFVMMDRSDEILTTLGAYFKLGLKALSNLQKLENERKGDNIKNKCPKRCFNRFQWRTSSLK